MVTRVRPTLAVAMIWLATVAAVSATAWFAIDRAGRSITGVDLSSLPVPSSVTAVPTRVPGAPEPASSPSSSASPTSSSSPSAPVDHRDRSVSLPGGQVSVRCTGATIRLRIAQPANGRRVEVSDSGPHLVDLEFKNGSDDSGSGVKVRAVCTNGAPAFTVEGES